LQREVALDILNVDNEAKYKDGANMDGEKPTQACAKQNSLHSWALEAWLVRLGIGALLGFLSAQLAMITICHSISMMFVYAVRQIGSAKDRVYHLTAPNCQQ
jgi:hypothetical protein